MQIGFQTLTANMSERLIIEKSFSQLIENPLVND